MNIENNTTTKPKEKFKFSDWFKLNKTISPKIIKILYVLAMVINTFFSIIVILQISNFFYGLAHLLIGPLVIRLIAEGALIIFSINDNLTAIKETLQNKSDNI